MKIGVDKIRELLKNKTETIYSGQALEPDRDYRVMPMYVYNELLLLLPQACEICGGSGISKKCPQCGENLIKVSMSANSPLNEDQFDSIRAGDYYCPKCPDNNRGKGKKCYWWKSDIPCPACQAPAEEKAEVSTDWLCGFTTNDPCQALQEKGE